MSNCYLQLERIRLFRLCRAGWRRRVRCPARPIPGWSDPSYCSSSLHPKITKSTPVNKLHFTSMRSRTSPSKCIFTARKWSLGQSNIFTPVSHSVYRRGLHLGGSALCIGGGGVRLLGRPCPQTDTTGYGQRTGGTHSTGMHFCFTIVLSLFMDLISGYEEFCVYFFNQFFLLWP